MSLSREPREIKNEFAKQTKTLLVCVTILIQFNSRNVLIEFNMFSMSSIERLQHIYLDQLAVYLKGQYIKKLKTFTLQLNQVFIWYFKACIMHFNVVESNVTMYNSHNRVSQHYYCKKMDCQNRS